MSLTDFPSVGTAGGDEGTMNTHLELEYLSTYLGNLVINLEKRKADEGTLSRFETSGLHQNTSGFVMIGSFRSGRYGLLQGKEKAQQLPRRPNP